MEALKWANLGLRFLLELCALATVGYWGFYAGDGPFMKVLLGIGAPILIGVVWGMYVAPRARFTVSEPLRLLIEVAVFTAATAALAFSNMPTFAWALAIAYVANRVLLFVLKS